MKGFIVEANLEWQGVNNTVYHFVGSNVGVEMLLKKRQHQEKGEIEDWDVSLQFVLRFQKNSIYILRLRFSEDITKRCKVYTKIDPWFQKSYDEFRKKLQKSSGKSKKLKFDGLLLPKKYISSAKALHTGDLSNITFNYLCENSLDFLCHFSTGTTLLYFFGSNIKVANHSANFQTFYNLG